MLVCYSSDMKKLDKYWWEVKVRNVKDPKVYFCYPALEGTDNVFISIGGERNYLIPSDEILEMANIIRESKNGE